jgi:ABC-2 type transport system ATP-binding protein
MAAVVELHRVGKRYTHLEEAASFRAVLPFSDRRRDELWALRDLDLQIDAGELVGVLGHNGAGKTTLLRLLAGVSAPTEGHLRVVGRIAPLISLGVGFHPEMSGRENVLVNGMLLGLSADQVSQRFDAIVDFAELEEFIDTPVKFYSSGMTMRLAFAVLVHTGPSVLLVDEILAVGDAQFQLKCFERLQRFRSEGAAIVMVSHALHTLRQLCERAILLRRGQLVYDGNVEQAIALHYESISAEAESGDGMSVEVVSQEILGDDEGRHHANYDDLIAVGLHLRFHRDVRDAILEFSLVGDRGDSVTVSRVALGSASYSAGEEARLRVEFRARLGAGTYRPRIQIRDPEGGTLGEAEGLVLFISGRPASVGPIDLRAEIDVDGVDLTDWRPTLL